MIFILLKIKSFLLLIVRNVRKAFCCFRLRRRENSLDDTSESLTHVGVVPNKREQIHSEDWNQEWDQQNERLRKPQTIEEHIQSYREKITQSAAPDVNKEEEDALNNMFQEMTPQVIKQKRIVIQPESAPTNEAVSTQLTLKMDYVRSDLEEWIDEAATGWDEQQFDPMDILREQKKLKREHKKQQTIGVKLKS